MGKIFIGINMEFVRSGDHSFEWGVKKASKLGYEYIEPMVHNGRELLSEAGYFHSVSMDNDPLVMRELCEKYGVKISALSTHCPLTKPEISIPYLTKAARFAAECGAPVLTTDEGPKHPWTTEAQDFELIKYTLQSAARFAERRGLKIGVEPHQQYTVHPELYERIIDSAESDAVAANFDTGNAYLCGQNPYIWLEQIKDRLVHLHAKDISVQQSSCERGKVTGTPVGCACGDGVIDWERVIAICRPLPRDLVFSVECGTVEQAARSIEHLRKRVL
ncbi:MAG: sugar phosphate isomerase/epimerase [Thermoguttaceae bacterium]|nr:sugar phosphate isomerase/epimerase [Thermoguttaceae bacterium]